MFETDLTRRLNIRFPIIQAPMAGGLTTTKLIAEVSNAGGLGSLGAAYLTPEILRRTIQEIRQLTEQPFGVNLFVPEETTESQATIEKMTTCLNKYRMELGIKENPPIENVSESFEEQVQVLLEEKVPVFSFTFGIPSKDVIQAMKKQGTTVIGTATIVEEAKQLELAGVDAIVAQGSEAGGHNVYKKTILSANEDSTVVTRAYSGRAARGIQTKFIKEMDQYPGEIPVFPIQNAMTRDIRQAAAKVNNPEYMSLWAGQGLRLATDHSAGTIIKQTMDQSHILLEKIIKVSD